MSTDNIDLAALNRDLHEFGRQQRQHQRRWRKVRLVALIVLLVIAAGAGVAYWLLLGRVHRLEVYQTAMQAIGDDKQLRHELGEPIQSAIYPFPGSRIEEREIDLRWPIQGPKGRADAHLTARLMMGNWETVILEVVLADNRKLSLRSAIDTSADAPAFDHGTAPKDDEKPADEAPPPEINLPIPPVEPPGE